MCFGDFLSTHVERYASTSGAVRDESRKVSAQAPQRRMNVEADLASGGMKPSTTSTKKPEKPQPTATRHSTSNGRGIVSRSGGAAALGWVSSRRVRGRKKERRVKQMSANVVSCDSARIDTIPMRRGAEVNKSGTNRDIFKTR